MMKVASTLGVLSMALYTQAEVVYIHETSELSSQTMCVKTISSDPILAYSGLVQTTTPDLTLIEVEDTQEIRYCNIVVPSSDATNDVYYRTSKLTYNSKTTIVVADIKSANYMDMQFPAETVLNLLSGNVGIYTNLASACSGSDLCIYITQGTDASTAYTNVYEYKSNSELVEYINATFSRSSASVACSVTNPLRLTSTPTYATMKECSQGENVNMMPSDSSTCATLDEDGNEKTCITQNDSNYCDENEWSMNVYPDKNACCLNNTGACVSDCFKIEESININDLYCADPSYIDSHLPRVLNVCENNAVVPPSNTYAISGTVVTVTSTYEIQDSSYIVLTSFETQSSHETVYSTGYSDSQTCHTEPPSIILDYCGLPMGFNSVQVGSEVVSWSGAEQIYSQEYNYTVDSLSNNWLKYKNDLNSLNLDPPQMDSINLVLETTQVYTWAEADNDASIWKLNTKNDPLKLCTLSEILQASNYIAATKRYDMRGVSHDMFSTNNLPKLYTDSCRNNQVSPEKISFDYLVFDDNSGLWFAEAALKDFVIGDHEYDLPKVWFEFVESNFVLDHSQSNMNTSCVPDLTIGGLADPMMAHNFSDTCGNEYITADYCTYTDYDGENTEDSFKLGLTCRISTDFSSVDSSSALSEFDIELTDYILYNNPELSYVRTVSYTRIGGDSGSCTSDNWGITFKNGCDVEVQYTIEIENSSDLLVDVTYSTGSVEAIFTVVASEAGSDIVASSDMTTVLYPRRNKTELLIMEFGLPEFVVQDGKVNVEEWYLSQANDGSRTCWTRHEDGEDVVSYATESGVWKDACGNFVDPLDISYSRSLRGSVYNIERLSYSFSAYMSSYFESFMDGADLSDFSVTLNYDATAQQLSSGKFVDLSINSVLDVVNGDDMFEKKQLVSVCMNDLATITYVSDDCYSAETTTNYLESGADDDGNAYKKYEVRANTTVGQYVTMEYLTFAQVNNTVFESDEDYHLRMETFYEQYSDISEVYVRDCKNTQTKILNDIENATYLSEFDTYKFYSFPLVEDNSTICNSGNMNGVYLSVPTAVASTTDPTTGILDAVGEKMCESGYKDKVLSYAYSEPQALTIMCGKTIKNTLTVINDAFTVTGLVHTDTETYNSTEFGSWTRICTCPSGNQYLVGDRYDSCATNGCFNGTLSGVCDENVTGGSNQSLGHGIYATCGPGPSFTDYTTPLLDEIVGQFTDEFRAKHFAVKTETEYLYKIFDVSGNMDTYCANSLADLCSGDVDNIDALNNKTYTFTNSKNLETSVKYTGNPEEDIPLTGYVLEECSSGYGDTFTMHDNCGVELELLSTTQLYVQGALEDDHVTGRLTGTSNATGYTIETLVFASSDVYSMSSIPSENVDYYTLIDDNNSAIVTFTYETYSTGSVIKEDYSSIEITAEEYAAYLSENLVPFSNTFTIEVRETADIDNQDTEAVIDEAEYNSIATSLNMSSFENYQIAPDYEIRVYDACLGNMLWQAGDDYYKSRGFYGVSSASYESGSDSDDNQKIFLSVAGSHHVLTKLADSLPMLSILITQDYSFYDSCGNSVYLELIAVHEYRSYVDSQGEIKYRNMLTNGLQLDYAQTNPDMITIDIGHGDHQYKLTSELDTEEGIEYLNNRYSQGILDRIYRISVIQQEIAIVRSETFDFQSIDLYTLLSGDADAVKDEESKLLKAYDLRVCETTIVYEEASEYKFGQVSQIHVESSGGVSNVMKFKDKIGTGYTLDGIGSRNTGESYSVEENSYDTYFDNYEQLRTATADITAYVKVSKASTTENLDYSDESENVDENSIVMTLLYCFTKRGTKTSESEYMSYSHFTSGDMLKETTTECQAAVEVVTIDIGSANHLMSTDVSFLENRFRYTSQGNPAYSDVELVTAYAEKVTGIPGNAISIDNSFIGLYQAENEV